MGFSADFHRKSLDIVKQHSNNAEISANSMFKVSNQAPKLVNISSTVWFGKNWELENEKKIRVLASQKVAKTGNIGKKSPVAGDIDYVSYLSMQKVKLNWCLQVFVFICGTCPGNVIASIVNTLPILLNIAVMDSMCFRKPEQIKGFYEGLR